MFQGCVDGAMKLKMVYPFLGKPKELEYRHALLKKGFFCWRATVLSKNCTLDLKPSSLRAWDISNVLTEGSPSPRILTPARPQTDMEAPVREPFGLQ